jgi:Deltex C-terminal domain
MSSAQVVAMTAPKDSSSLQPFMTASHLSKNKERALVLHLLHTWNLIENSNDDRPASFVRLFSVETITTAAKRLLAMQDLNRAAGKPTAVDLGYHYTSVENLTSIREHGLLTTSERSSENIKAKKDHGETYGEGIYTAANPFAYHGTYGDVGILVARLLGTNADFGEHSTGLDSLTVFRNQDKEFAVLATSHHCIPILVFDAKQIVPKNPLSPGNLTLEKYHVSVQEAVDQILNLQRLSSNPIKAVREEVTQFLIFGEGPMYETILYVKPSTSPFESKQTSSEFSSRAPISAKHDTCGLCLLPLTSGPRAGSPMVEHTTCKAEFHQACLAQVAPACPVCWKLNRGHVLRGKMPCGKMVVKYSPSDTCAGYSTGSIVIEYIIASGLQENYHDNPGIQYSGVHRVAYLPVTVQGRNLLKRLKYAFRHGLTFKVGVSLATGRDNSVTWASILHKTSLKGGAERYGYPDPQYFLTCNRQLDALSVPVASSLP